MDCEPVPDKMSFTLNGHRYPNVHFTLLLVLLLTSVSVSACARPAPEATSTQSPEATSTQSPEATSTQSPVTAEKRLEEGTAELESTDSQPMPGKGNGSLSGRLQVLADNPVLQKQDPAAQAQALGLPADGSGSLMRNQAGDLLVQIRITVVSESNLDVLRGAGAQEIQVDEAFRTVTAFVDPSDLASLATLEFVENIREELRP